MRDVSSIVYWPPRILAILFILFIAMFSLDVFTPGAGFWEILAGLFMHNIPTLVLIGVLVAAWKYEWIGGAVFILAGLGYMFLTARGDIPWYTALSWSMTIAGPAFLVGALFLVNWFLKDRPGAAGI